MSETEKLAEDLIRERAYALWEQEGRKEGQSDGFWDRAKREVESAELDAVIEPEPASSKTPSPAVIRT
jgi:hypothetical protein